jgi:succinate dehydrogenase / fumarate reductase iron-sulfur subunit
MSKQKISVKVLRYNPEKDNKPHWSSYQLEAEHDSTILDILNEIRWNIDGSLSYRRSCRSAICGSCAMKVNGQNVLACETAMHKFKTKKLKIEPLPGFRIIKDLVVDMDNFFEKLKQIKPFLILNKSIPDKEFSQSPEQFSDISESVLCILCGACTSSCPNSRDDGAIERIDIINDKNGIWRCHTIFNCMEACPKNINITEFLSKLKVKVVENSI